MIDPNSGQARQSTTVSVTVSPTTASVQTNATKQFTATRDQRHHPDRELERQRRSGRQLRGGPDQQCRTLYRARRAAVRWNGDGSGREHGLALGHRHRHRHSHRAARRAGSEFDCSQQWNAGHERRGDARRFQLPSRARRSRSAAAASPLRASRWSAPRGSRRPSSSPRPRPPALTASPSATSAGSSAAQSFTVNAPAPAKPTLTSLAPNAATRGARSRSRSTGTNFTSPATVTVQGGAVSVSNVVVVSSTKITATFHVSATAARRSRDTSVTTAAGTSNARSFVVQ